MNTRGFFCGWEGEKFYIKGVLFFVFRVFCFVGFCGCECLPKEYKCILYCKYKGVLVDLSEFVEEYLIFDLEEG